MGRGRRRQSKPEPVAFEKVTDETIQEHYEAIAKAKEEHEEALKEAKSKHGMLRARFKDAVRAGIPQSRMMWRLAQRFRTPDDIDKETRENNRIARATNLPLGTQLGVDHKTGETIATQIDNEQQAEQQNAPAVSAFEEGETAAKAGKTLSANRFLEGSDEFDQFEEGWKKGTGDNLFGKNVPHTAGKGKGRHASAGAAAH